MTNRRGTAPGIRGKAVRGSRRAGGARRESTHSQAPDAVPDPRRPAGRRAGPPAPRPSASGLPPTPALRAAGDAADGAQPDPEAARHCAVAEPQGPLLSEDFPDLAHGQSLGRRRTPFVDRGGRRAEPSSVARSGVRPRFGGRIACAPFTISDLGLRYPPGAHSPHRAVSRAGWSAHPHVLCLDERTGRHHSQGPAPEARSLT